MEIKNTKFVIMVNKMLFWGLLLINNLAFVLFNLILLMGGGGKGGHMNFFIVFFLVAFSFSIFFSLITLFFAWAFKKDLNFSFKILKRIFLIQFTLFFTIYLLVLLYFTINR